MTFPVSVLLEPLNLRYIPEPAPLPVYHRVLHDQEAKDGKWRVGYPEVWPLHLSRYCDLTEAWQRYWFALLIHSYTRFTHWDETRLTKAEMTMLKGKWASLTKSTEAFTNFQGTNKYEDYIRNVNMGTGLPGQEPIICCGNVARALGEPVRLSGVLKTPIETLDGSKPPPPIERVNRLTTPWLIFCATNASPGYLPDGRQRVDPFPQLAPRDTLVPLRTHGADADRYARDGVNCAVNYITTSRLRAVVGVPSPYVP